MLYEAGKAVNSVLRDEVLQLILSSAFELLEASSGSILLLDHRPAGGGRPRRRRRRSRFRIELGEGIAGRVAGTAIRSSCRAASPSTASPARSRARCACRCCTATRCLGVLSLVGASGHVYTEHDLRAVSLFAEHAAIAVANARLYEAEGARVPSSRTRWSTTPSPAAANRVLVSDRLRHGAGPGRRTQASMAVLFIDVDNFKIVERRARPCRRGLHAVGHRRAPSECVEPPTPSVATAATSSSWCARTWPTPPRPRDRRSGAPRPPPPVLHPLRRPHLTASIGVAICNADDLMSGDDLVREADRAMYRGKMEGKDRVITSVHGPTHVWPAARPARAAAGGPAPRRVPSPRPPPSRAHLVSVHVRRLHNR